ncbi:MAG: class I SAM-dependent methyltransferase [Candidatus Melainabacteria bacterium]|nr:class I SAM-dependent methyltransferase [Candidatus Melainabacteria bacterium]
MTVVSPFPNLKTLANHPEFTLVGGIPRQKSVYSTEQAQTAETFGFKWAKRDTYESPEVETTYRNWLQEKYVRASGLDLAGLTAGKSILDAGCGAGQSALLLFGDCLKQAHYLGLDISTAVEVAAQRFAEKAIPGEFVQCSLLDIPAELGNFDVIFSEGVLHHTDSTEQAVRYLAGRLNPGGTLMFYVYKKKAPIREFTDDAIREQLATLSNEAAWEALMPLTKLGKTLGDLDLEINVEDDIDLLGIPAGKHPLQRLFYWYIFKAYHRPDWTLEEMNHVNFDWYRPTNCHRHTPEEVRGWLDALGLTVKHLHVEEAGITAIAQRGA